METLDSQTRTYLDFIELVDALAAHTRATGDHVLPADQPPHLGYLAIRYATESVAERAVLFQIRTNDIEPSLARHDATNPEKARLLRKALATSAGRLRLAVSFPGQAIDQPEDLVHLLGVGEPTSTPE